MQLRVQAAGLLDLASDMDRAALVAPRVVRPVVARSAKNMRDDMKEHMRVRKHFKGQAGPSRQYEADDGARGAWAETWVGAGRFPSALSNIAIWGGANGGGGTAEGPDEAMKREEPRLMKWLDTVVGELI